MVLLTLIQAELAKFVSDTEIFKFIAKAIFTFLGVLFTAIFSFIAWGIKTLIKHFKEYKEVKQKETEAFQGKFEAINEYMNETDKVQMIHTRIIGDVEEKTKILETKSEKHGRLLAEHEIQIEYLKKDADTK